MLDIVKGKQNAPVRAVLYGPEGIGKSTLAAAFPAPLFVDAEGGTNRLDVDRIHPLSWSAVQTAVDELLMDAHGYKTLVFDTADWLEKMLVENVCQAANKSGIEDFGYGKGYTHLAEGWKKFLDKLANLQRVTGLHVVFLAHAAMRKFEQPDEAGAYDRWELKLLKQSPGIIKEWADAVLFLNYKTIVVETDGKHKAQGGHRVMFTEHHPCWDAKNRFALKPELPLEFKSLAPMFAGGSPAAKPQTATPATAAPAALPPKGGVDPVKKMDALDMGEAKPAAVPAASPEKAGLLAQLAELMKTSGITKDELGAELARKGVVPADMNPREYNDVTLKRVIAGWTAITNNAKARRQQAAA